MRAEAVAAEKAHQVIFEREEEDRRAGVALTAGASAQLAVDPAGFVPFGTDNMQTADRSTTPRPSLMSVPRPAMLVAIVTAPRMTGVGHDLRFALVLFGVQHIVRDPLAA